MSIFLLLLVVTLIIAVPMVRGAYRDAAEQKASSPLPEDALNWYGRKVTTKAPALSHRTEDDPAWTVWVNQYFANLR